MTEDTKVTIISGREKDKDAVDDFEDLDALEDAARAWTAYATEDDVVIKVNKVASYGKKEAQCFSFGPTDMDAHECESKILAEYGPGEYRLRAHKRNGQVLFNKGVNFAIPIVNAKELSESAQDKKADRELSTMELFMTMQQSQQNMMMQMQQQQQQTQSQNQQSMMTMLAAIMPAIMGNRNEVNPIEMQAAMVSQMVALKELSGKDNSLSEVLEGVRAIKEINNEGNTDEEGTSWARLAESFLPALLEAGTKGNRSQGTTARPRPSAAPDNISPVKTKEIAKIESAEKMTQYVSSLVNMAQSNMEADLAAEFVYQYVEEAMLDSLQEQLENKDFLQQLALFDSRVMEYEHWFVEVQGELLELLAADGSDLTDSEVERNTHKDLAENQQLSELGASNVVDGDQQESTTN